MKTTAIRIIGIDPGLRRTGWGVIESDGVRLSYIASGMVQTDSTDALAVRLSDLFRGLTAVLAEHAPQEAAVEETFVNENAKATLKLGQARGIALLAPALKSIRVAEYTPNLIKKTVVGAGHAEKKQIQMMVQMLLPKAKFDSADEADALAIAICHANHRSSPQAIALAQRIAAAEARPMIGKLRGKVDAIGESHLILDVNGVGYEVLASARTLRNLKTGDDASLTIDTHVREDAIKLYGFTSEVERTWFRTLQTIQGVGAKVALSVLGTLSPQDLANAIALGNWQAVEETNGVGKKLAQRIVIELKDKAPGLTMTALNVPPAPGSKPDTRAIIGNAPAEAISALTNLGYQPMQASQAVAAAMQDLGEGADVAKLIRRGLKELAR